MYELFFRVSQMSPFYDAPLPPLLTAYKLKHDYNLTLLIADNKAMGFFVMF